MRKVEFGWDCEQREGERDGEGVGMACAGRDLSPSKTEGFEMTFFGGRTETQKDGQMRVPHPAKGAG